MTNTMTAIQKFVYGGSVIEFDVMGNEIMINATEMAKLFGKKTAHFLENEQTKAFIKALSQSRNSDFGKIVKVIKGGINQGTWMNRRLALKFAGWLSPEFELWVYDTIERIMFGYTDEVKNSHEQLKMIPDRIKEIDQTASSIMKERYRLSKQRELIQENNLRLLGLN